MRFTSRIADIKYTLRGSENLGKDQSCVIIANHQSGLDLIGMFELWPVIHRMSVISKKELLYVGTFGIAAWLAGVTFIDRKSGGKAGQAMNEAMENFKKKNIKLWVFPEGTRRNTGEIHEFKKGAFHSAIKAQVPIVPVVYSSYKHFVNSEKKIFDKGEIIITVLPEISTEGLTLEDVVDLMQRTRNLMIEKYNETSSETFKRSKEL